jgi:hypothetical protein
LRSWDHIFDKRHSVVYTKQQFSPTTSALSIPSQQFTMFARLTALVGSGSALPFEVQAQQPSAWGNWTHFKGVLKADGSPISIFRISAPSTNDAKLQAARNGIKRLRTVRCNFTPVNE